MATRDRESIKRSTVGWVPGFLRNFFGLEDTFQRPSYAQTTSSQVAESTTGWIPAPVRRWLGLDYTEPQRYAPSEPTRPSPPPTRYIAAAPAPARPSMPSSPAPAAYQSTSASFGGRSADYRPPSVEGSGKMTFGRGEPRGSGNGESRTPATTSAQPIQTQGYVQPFTYLLRGYLRGALPPQGLEAFTRQLRQTTTDVVDLYGRTIRFQTEEISKAFGNLFSGEKQATSSGAPTRIPIERVENKNKLAASAAPSAPSPSPSKPAASAEPSAPSPSPSPPAPAKPAAEGDSSAGEEKPKT
jgi:hypothetical protein